MSYINIKLNKEVEEKSPDGVERKNMNQVILIGRLARDPELDQRTGVCKFTIAVDRPRRQGEDAGADFIRITVFGKQAETCDRYLSKGRQVAVQARLRTGSYTNREGVKVSSTDVIADRVEFLGSGGGSASGGKDASESHTGAGNSAGGATASIDSEYAHIEENTPWDDQPDTFEAADDDIPF